MARTRRNLVARNIDPYRPAGCIKVTSMLDDTPPGLQDIVLPFPSASVMTAQFLCGGGVGAHEQPPATASNVSRSILGQ